MQLHATKGGGGNQTVRGNNGSNISHTTIKHFKASFQKVQSQGRKQH